MSWNNSMTNMTNLHTWTTCRVYLIISFVLLTNWELLKITSYMISSSRICIPVGVNCVCVGGRSNQALIRYIILIKTMSTVSSKMSLFEAYLTERPTVVGVASLWTLIGTLLIVGVSTSSSIATTAITWVTTATTWTLSATASSVHVVCRGAWSILNFQSSFKAEKLCICLSYWDRLQSSD